LHLAFLDTENELATANPPIDTASIGGIEGSSGTPGENWRARAIINLCGALSDTKWMNNNRDIAIFSVHGTNDEIVPYKINFFSAFNVKIAQVSGSFIVDSIAKMLGMKSILYTFQNAPHVPFTPGIGTIEQSTAYMDTTERLLRDFLLTEIMRPLSAKNELSPTDIQLFPNPATNYATIRINKGTHFKVQLVDAYGKLVVTKLFDQPSFTLDLNNLPAGMYIISVTNEYGKIHRKLRIE